MGLFGFIVHGNSILSTSIDRMKRVRVHSDGISTKAQTTARDHCSRWVELDGYKSSVLEVSYWLLPCDADSVIVA